MKLTLLAVFTVSDYNKRGYSLQVQETLLQQSEYVY